MLTSEIACPHCGFEFTAPIWIDGHCENCGSNYYWSMEFNDDLTDGWHVLSWTANRSLYVASTLSNWKRVRAFIEYFKSLNIPIAFDWTSHGEDIFHLLKPRDLDPVSLQEKALDEYKGVSTASYVLIIEPSGRGTNFEFGVAYQRYTYSNSPTIAILEESKSKGPVSFHYLPDVKRFACARSAITDVLKHFDIDIKDINVDMATFGLGNSPC